MELSDRVGGDVSRRAGRRSSTGLPRSAKRIGLLMATGRRDRRRSPRRPPDDRRSAAGPGRRRATAERRRTRDLAKRARRPTRSRSSRSSRSSCRCSRDFHQSSRARWPQGQLDLLLPSRRDEALARGRDGILDHRWRRRHACHLAGPWTRSADEQSPPPPLVLTGLAVGVGFKAGLFNIGGTGLVARRRFLRCVRGRRDGRSTARRRSP